MTKQYKQAFIIWIFIICLITMCTCTIMYPDSFGINWAYLLCLLAGYGICELKHYFEAKTKKEDYDDRYHGNDLGMI
jgi:hypothetical protein